MERWRGRAKFKSGALPTQCRMPGANAASLFFPQVPPLDMTVLVTQSIKRLNTKSLGKPKAEFVAGPD